MRKVLEFKRNKDQCENNETGTLEESEQNSHNIKQHRFSWFVGGKKKQNQRNEMGFSEPNPPNRELGRQESKVNINGNDKIAVLIKKVKKTDGKLIIPTIDLMADKITFPLLKEINVNETNIQFLENLTSPSFDVLEKAEYERLTICPQHPESFSVNVRFYCPKCHSMDIEKLHLCEHKVCGYISEKKNFAISKDGIITQCPSCKKNIKDGKKELRIPAMWYTCLTCKKKFDDVSIKLHCRKFDHDFDTNVAQTISIPSYKLKDTDNESDSDSSISKNLKTLLLRYGFSSEENCSVKGKSGHYHNIDLLARDDNNNTIFIFIIKSKKVIEESEINSKIIQVLDVSPDLAILIGTLLSKKAKSMALRYNISVIESQDGNGIISALVELLSEKLGK